MTRLKLTYFNFPGGRAEPARLAMVIGGIPFEDDRFAPGDFPEIRKAAPLAQVPVLRVDGRVVTQSDAITRYVGKLAGLYPEDALQALLCDEILSAMEDVTTRIGATFGLSGEALESARTAIATEMLPRYLRWLDTQLSAQGGNYFADQRLTIADLKVFAIVRWLSSGMLDHIPAGIVATEAPALIAHKDRVAGEPAIAAYYKKLGVS